MRFSNLHTHTLYSDGKGTVRENIESAIKKNMISLGFSDHAYTYCDESYCMMLSDYEKYCSDGRNAKLGKDRTDSFGSTIYRTNYTLDIRLLEKDDSLVSLLQRIRCK